MREVGRSPEEIQRFPLLLLNRMPGRLIGKKAGFRRKQSRPKYGISFQKRPAFFGPNSFRLPWLAGSARSGNVAAFGNLSEVQTVKGPNMFPNVFRRSKSPNMAGAVQGRNLRTLRFCARSLNPAQQQRASSGTSSAASNVRTTLARPLIYPWYKPLDIISHLRIPLTVDSTNNRTSRSTVRMNLVHTPTRDTYSTRSFRS